MINIKYTSSDYGAGVVVHRFQLWDFPELPIDYTFNDVIKNPISNFTFLIPDRIQIHNLSTVAKELRAAADFIESKEKEDESARAQEVESAKSASSGCTRHQSNDTSQDAPEGRRYPGSEQPGSTE